MSYGQNLKIFKSLHQQNEPLLLGNVWDAKSAQLAEKASFKALGSSSHAIAFTLGYADGEEISVDELLFVVKRIVEVVKIPVSVDFEAGYSDDPDEVVKNVEKLIKLGVVGINLEDGQVLSGQRKLCDAELMAQKIKAIKRNSDIFINARTDTYTTKYSNALEESIRRSLLYQAAGADGVFVPLIESEEDIKKFIAEVQLPLNVFTTPKLAAYDQLGQWGVKRISHGAKQYDALMKKSENTFKEFMSSKDYSIILGS